MLVTANIYLDALFLLLGDNSDRSRSTVKELLDVTDKQNGKKDIISIDDELITVYRNLIKSVMAENITQENETASKLLLLRIRNNEILKSHPLERDILSDVLSSKQPIGAEQIDGYLKKIRNQLITAELDASARKIFAKTRMIADIQDPEEQEAEIAGVKALFDGAMKAIEHRQNTSNVKASETYVSMADSDSILRALDKYMDRSVRGVIRTGLQGLNKALGKRGGIGLGETAVFAASSHNYKSGILLSILIWTIAYNKFVVEPGRKAMVYFVSLENEVHQNVMIIFTALYTRVEKKAVDVNTFTPEFIKNWLQEYFSQFDIHVVIDRYSPHEFSYQRYIQRYNAFVDMGFQLVLFDLDYMSEARGVDPGDTFSNQGQIQLIKENYIKFVNHAKSQGYALTTGHQLTKKAEEVAAIDRYAVRKFNPSMMADSSDVHRIVDILIFIQLVTNVHDVKFMMAILRKNRGSQDTPERDKFFAYPFTPFGIEDDIHSLPGYTQDIDAWGSEFDSVETNLTTATLY